jgi:hypothetical protein
MWHDDVSEDSMHESQARIHYAPASVGALIDTALLRRAIRDAEGANPVDAFAPVSRRPWRSAMRAFVNVCLRRGKPGRTGASEDARAIAGVEKSGG